MGISARTPSCAQQVRSTQRSSPRSRCDWKPFRALGFTVSGLASCSERSKVDELGVKRRPGGRVGSGGGGATCGGGCLEELDRGRVGCLPVWDHCCLWRPAHWQQPDGRPFRSENTVPDLWYIPPLHSTRAPKTREDSQYCRTPAPPPSDQFISYNPPPPTTILLSISRTLQAVGQLHPARPSSAFLN